MKIKDLPKLDRPRERLVEVGKENISNEELLSILIKTGTKDKSAKEVSQEILKELGSIKELKTITLESLTKIKGIGKVKAIDLLASIELGTRINANVLSINNVKFNSPEIIYEYYKDNLGLKQQEHFYCIYLNTKKIIIKEKLLFIGTINKSIVNPREVIKEGLLCDASSIICVHNHPSGNVLPSKEDVNLTYLLRKLAGPFGIDVIDHIIISQHSYYSLYENGDI